jgi:hypothetical protein
MLPHSGVHDAVAPPGGVEDQVTILNGVQDDFFFPLHQSLLFPDVRDEVIL